MLRKVLLTLVIILLLIAAGGFLAYRNGVHPALVVWIVDQTWERTSDFEARVEGDVDIMGLSVTAAGRMRHKRPDLYDLDLNSIRVIAGSRDLWVIVPAFKAALKVHSQAAPAEEMLRGMVDQWEERNPENWVREATRRPAEVTLYAAQVIEGERCWVLEWPARTGERIGGRLYVSQRSRAPIKFDQMNSAGQVTRTYTMRKFRRNIGLTEGDFSYEPMAGYSVVEVKYDPDKEMVLEDLLQGLPDVDKLRKKLDKHLPGDVSDWLDRHGV